MKEKICTKCKISKHLCEFNKRSRNKDGLDTQCRQCRKEHCDSMREHIRELDKKSYYKNKENRHIKGRVWGYNKRGNPLPKELQDKFDEYRKKIDEKVPRDYKAQKETDSKRLRKYKKEHRDIIRVQNQIYAQTENGRRNNILKGLRRRARQTELLHTLTPDEIKALYKFQEGKCACCKRDFSNTNRYEIDHIVPILNGGPTVLSNVQLLCRSCNASKHTKTIRYIPEIRDISELVSVG